MTATEVQNHARVLGNSSWCRYWLLWEQADKSGFFVALQCRDESGVPQPIKDAHTMGYDELTPDFVYLAPRTNDDGTSYVLKF